MADPFLPFALPLIGEEEIAEVVDTLRSGWLTSGPKTRRFEEAFARRLDMPHAVAVNSATAGLHLALEALGLQPGDQVLTTPFTFTATAEVVRYLGADPVFADIDETTCNLDPAAAARVLEATPGVRFLIPVHYAGQACDMDALLALAAAHELTVVEDAAHAFPTTYKGRMVGQLGAATVFSFYATKTLATGEGGMVVTADAAVAARMRTMRLHGINRDVFDRYTATRPSWYYEVVAPGFKYNMTDVAAALGLHQLARADAMADRRRAIADAYTEAFDDLPLQLPTAVRPDDAHARHLYPVLLDTAALTLDRDGFIEALSAAGIGTSVHFIPLYHQPYWRDRYGLRPEQFPRCEAVYRRTVSLPIYPAMTDADVARVIDVVRTVLRGARR